MEALELLHPHTIIKHLKYVLSDGESTPTGHRRDNQRQRGACGTTHKTCIISNASKIFSMMLDPPITGGITMEGLAVPLIRHCQTPQRFSTRCLQQQQGAITMPTVLLSNPSNLAYSATDKTRYSQIFSHMPKQRP